VRTEPLAHVIPFRIHKNIPRLPSKSNQPKRPVGRPKNDREHYMFKLNPGSATCFGGLKTLKECPEAKSSNERSFGSPAAGVSTDREGKCPKHALFHRTDEGAPGPGAAGRRLALRNQIRRLSGLGLQRRQRCAPGLTQ